MKNDTTRAVRELRMALKDTQQQFAARLGLAISTVVRYELTRPPRGKALAQLAEVARSAGRLDLAGVFSGALEGELVNTENQIDAGIIRALVENRGRAWLRKELEALITEAKAGVDLRYPNIFLENREPDQKMRREYLEGLLVQLRVEMDGSSLKIVETMAEQLQRETGQTVEQARAAVWIAHPELYEKYNQEKADAASDTAHAESLAVPGTSQHEASRKRKGK